VGSAKKKVLFRTERIALSCGSRSKEDRSSDQDCVLSQPHSNALIGLALVMSMQGIESHSCNAFGIACNMRSAAKSLCITVEP
jgi:hypothetical protein